MRKLASLPAVPALAIIFAAACAASEPPNSRVTVAFVAPEKFTDARRAELESASAGILQELERFLVENGVRNISEPMRLAVRITDIDLAGDFEPFRGPRADRVRIEKGLYPPRITLDFVLTEGGAQVLRSGKRRLTDLGYQSRAAEPRQDYLRHEKELLGAWLRSEFAALRRGAKPMRRDRETQ